jgi:hypothetical protein
MMSPQRKKSTTPISDAAGYFSKRYFLPKNEPQREVAKAQDATEHTEKSGGVVRKQVFANF